MGSLAVERKTRNVKTLSIKVLLDHVMAMSSRSSLRAHDRENLVSLQLLRCTLVELRGFVRVGMRQKVAAPMSFCIPLTTDKQSYLLLTFPMHNINCASENLSFKQTKMVSKH